MPCTTRQRGAGGSARRRPGAPTDYEKIQGSNFRDLKHNENNRYHHDTG